MRVAVIGGGPGGLVTLKYLLSAHKHLSTSLVEARLFEANSEIGGVFCSRVYEDAEVRDPQRELPLCHYMLTGILVTARLFQILNHFLRFPTSR
jgi:cation diffusion facilitator CzcD-associated flavoprotein CzcO